MLTRGATPYDLRAVNSLLGRASRPRGDCLGILLRCLPIEKSCERLAVLTSLEQASMLAHRTGADQDPWRCACAGAATKSWPIDRSSLGQVASSPSTAANKKLLRKWWQKQGPRANSTTAAQVSSKCWPTAMDASRPSATMTDA